MLHKIESVLNIDTHPHSFREKLISAVGAFIGIYFTYAIALQFLDTTTALYITASMGASAVLLFAVPHGVLSGPWSVIGGHVLSALVGVSIGKLIENPLLAASFAVGLAVLLMQLSKSVHPPGGATALIAIIGGQSVHKMGFDYVIFPILINALTITITAILFNYLFSWRRYPPVFSNQRDTNIDDIKNNLAEKIENAISELDIYVDVSTEELVRIFEHIKNK